MGVRMKTLELMWDNDPGQGDQGGGLMAALRRERNHELEEAIGVENENLQVEGPEY